MEENVIEVKAKEIAIKLNMYIKGLKTKTLNYTANDIVNIMKDLGIKNAKTFWFSGFRDVLPSHKSHIQRGHGPSPVLYNWPNEVICYTQLTSIVKNVEDANRKQMSSYYERKGSDKISQAIKLLKDNGYKVLKPKQTIEYEEI